MNHDMGIDEIGGQELIAVVFDRSRCLLANLVGLSGKDEGLDTAVGGGCVLGFLVGFASRMLRNGLRR